MIFALYFPRLFLLVFSWLFLGWFLSVSCLHICWCIFFFVSTWEWDVVSHRVVDQVKCFCSPLNLSFVKCGMFGYLSTLLHPHRSYICSGAMIIY